MSWILSRKVVELEEKVKEIFEKINNIPERNLLDKVEKEKENSRIVELELMVNELRSANIEMAKQLQQLDTDITTFGADLKRVESMQSIMVVDKVTPDENLYIAENITDTL
jgi:chromosome segregation ATPase